MELAAEMNADYVVAETFGHYGEALIALEAIQKYGRGKLSSFLFLRTVFILN